ncbi:hypothetical protein KRX19_06760 [Cardiobacteriaceae bacterium TAE3-ERU3]|nr:hypothetical protein [Cardiobacteriaceae bacterium TAE3-ERU3]
MMNKERYDEDALYKAANDIYSLYFIGWLIGFLAFIIGAVWAGMKVRKASDITHSHFKFQRSVALQGILILLAVGLFNFAWIWYFDGEWSTPVMIVTIIAYIRWWLVRCIAGYRILAQQQAIANPNTWGKPRAARSQIIQSVEE